MRAADAGLQSLTTTGIFIISGLGLRRGEALRALSAWGAILYGFTSILFITPLAALVVLRLPLGSPELAFGLAVFCCMPTTLSSGVSLTQVLHNLCLSLLNPFESQGYGRAEHARFTSRYTCMVGSNFICHI